MTTALAIQDAALSYRTRRDWHLPGECTVDAARRLAPLCADIVVRKNPGLDYDLLRREIESDILEWARETGQYVLSPRLRR